MASTNFQDGQSTTPIVAAWLNDVNVAVYEALGVGGVAPTTPDIVLRNLVSGKIISSIAALRAYTTSGATSAFVTSYYGDNKGGGGAFTLVTGAAAGTYVDNGGTIIVPMGGNGSAAWLRVVSDSGISILDFGADPSGVTDSSHALLAACASLGPSGGTIHIPQGPYKFLIASNTPIPSNVTLKGGYSLVGSPQNNASAPYGNLTALMIASTVTVTLSGGSGVDGVLIYRAGMTFPAADSSLFAGVALTAGGDDVFCINSMILGFNKAFYSSGFQRPRVSHLYHDNNNGIEITNCLDIPYLFENHAWPFATIAAGGAYTNHIRSGTAYYLHDIADWAKSTNNFSWGYLRGHHVLNANSVTMAFPGHDNAYSTVPEYANSIGIVVEGTSQDARIISPQTAAQAGQGIYINTSAGLETTIIGHDCWGGSTHAVLIDSGDVNLIGGTKRGLANGITVNNAASRVFIDGQRFQQITGLPVNPAVATSNVHVGANNDFGDFTAAVSAPNLTSPAIVSADPLPIPNSWDVITVTGTTNFGSLDYGYAGRTVHLIFTGILTVFSSTGGVNGMRLSGGTNYTSSAGSTLTLTHNGVQWYETGRSN